ncbi:hypothetical protein Tco_0658036 [Tanacetum coccineum]
MKATIKLIDPNTVIRVKPMCYSPQDRIEFTKQINELLDMKLIIQSKSPHMSPAFLVENEAEKRRGKKRMVVNYKKINEAYCPKDQKSRSQRIAELILQTITEGNKKVNYADSHCIIISHKNSTEDDINLINQFGLPFLKNTIEAKGTTKEAYCRQARQLFEEHSCIYCTESKDKEAGPSTPIKAVPTTEDESSSD